MFNREELININISIESHINTIQTRIINIQEDIQYWETSNDKDRDEFLIDAKESLVEANRELSEFMILRIKVKDLRSKFY
jgi:hypothetical protein